LLTRSALVYLQGSRQQIGFARFVTDAATFAYLCDVYVLEEYRERSLGLWLVQQALPHLALEGVRRDFSLRAEAILALKLGFG
jgi:hypothetical protein